MLCVAVELMLKPESRAAQVRSLSVLEGIALASDPNYKVLGAAYPWIARRLLTDRSPELKARAAAQTARRDFPEPRTVFPPASAPSAPLGAPPIPHRRVLAAAP